MSVVPLSVEDHLQIEQLAARYNLAIDLGDAQGWVDCFTDDGEFVVEPGGEWSASRGTTSSATSGKDDLLTLAKAIIAGPSLRHWSANRVLTETEDGVDSVSYMTILFLDGPLADQLLSGIMRDRLVHTADGWRFQRRFITFDR
jgi:hypothetical protein